MAVLGRVLAAGDVEPVVEAVGGFEDELVEVGVLPEEGDPAVGGFEVGVGTVVFPAGVGGLGKTDVGGFSEGVLAGIDASYTDVEGVGAVAAGDDDGLPGEGPQGFEDGAAELLEHWDVVHGDGVVDAVLFCCFGVFEFSEGEMFC